MSDLVSVRCDSGHKYQSALLNLPSNQGFSWCVWSARLRQFNGAF